MKPGETEQTWSARLEAEAANYERQRQRDLWRKADHVFTARVSFPAVPELAPARSSIRRGDGPPRPPRLVRLPAPDFSATRRAWAFEPLAALKGVAPARGFEIQQTMSWTSCGPSFEFNDATPVFRQSALQEEQIVVVFLTGPYPTQGSILATLMLDEVTDPDLKAALARVGASR